MTDLDSRLHAFRADLAVVALEGLVHGVEPEDGGVPERRDP